MAGKAPAPYPLDKQDFNVSMQDVEGKKTFEEPLVAKGTIHTVGKGELASAPLDTRVALTLLPLHICSRQNPSEDTYLYRQLGERSVLCVHLHCSAPSHPAAALRLCAPGCAPSCKARGQGKKMSSSRQMARDQLSRARQVQAFAPSLYTHMNPLVTVLASDHMA